MEGGAPATGEPGFQLSLAVPKVHIVSKTPPTSCLDATPASPRLVSSFPPGPPLPLPGRRAHRKAFATHLATGPRPAPPACRSPERRPKARGPVHPTSLDRSRISGDILGVELRTWGGGNGSPHALVPQQVRGTGAKAAGGGPRGRGEPSKAPRLSSCTGARSRFLSLQRVILMSFYADMVPCEQDAMQCGPWAGSAERGEMPAVTVHSAEGNGSRVGP